MLLELGEGASQFCLAAGFSHLPRGEADLYEWLNPARRVTNRRGDPELRAPSAAALPRSPDGRPRFFLFVKGARAAVKSTCNGFPSVSRYHNSLDPATGAFRIQACLSTQFGAAETAVMRRAAAACRADPSTRVLLTVYNGLGVGGRRVYYCFWAGELREVAGGGFFEGRVLAPLSRVPWVEAERARHAAARQQAAAPPPATPPRK